MHTEEKRKHDRIISLNLSYICLNESNEIVKQGMGRTLNVSESGILLETHFAIEASHSILLTIGLKEDIVDIKGRLIHAKEVEEGKYEVGIEFLEFDKDAEVILKKYIKAFKAKKSEQSKE